MLVTLCPSRGRPDAAWEVRESFLASRSLDGSRLIFVVEDDQLDAYAEMRGGESLELVVVEGGNMVKALNEAAHWTLGLSPRPELVGFVGDDHRFRTRGWDQHFLVKARETRVAMVYAHDGAWQKGEIPTQIFITPNVFEALGFFALPDCTHLYVDNAWMAIGEACDIIYWFPQVLIEHMHPAFGKAEWDEGHKRVNTEAMYSSDRAAFEAWRLSGRFKEDCRKVEGLLDV